MKLITGLFLVQLSSYSSSSRCAHKSSCPKTLFICWMDLHQRDVWKNYNSQSPVPELPISTTPWLSGAAKLVTASVPLHTLELSFTLPCIAAKISVLLNTHYYLSPYERDCNRNKGLKRLQSSLAGLPPHTLTGYSVSRNQDLFT